VQRCFECTMPQDRCFCARLLQPEAQRAVNHTAPVRAQLQHDATSQSRVYRPGCGLPKRGTPWNGSAPISRCGLCTRPLDLCSCTPTATPGRQASKAVPLQSGTSTPSTCLEPLSRTSSFTDLCEQVDASIFKLCFFAPFGTKGDLLPLFYGAVAAVVTDGADVLIACQPCFADMITERMSRALGFKLVDRKHLQFPGRCNKYSWSGSHSTLKRETEGMRTVEFSMEKVVYGSSSGGRLAFVWAQPAKGSCNETDYQQAFSVNGDWGKIDYGEFIGNWQGCVGYMKKYELARDAKFVTSHFERPSYVEKLDEAMGIESALILRLGSLGLSDPFAHLSDHRYYYAMSATIAPKAIPFSSMTVFPHPDIKKNGVLTEQTDIFEPLPLPADIAAFLDRMPTVAVTISSFGELNNVSKMFPYSPKFQVLFIGSSCGRNKNADRGPNHLHYGDMLDLDAVFQKAALIVHGCGAGTCHQVARSGKPSVGLSGFLEQECNGMALERLGISRHFTLKSLYNDRSVESDLSELIVSFFHSQATFADPEKLLEVQRAIQHEETSAHHAFRQKLSQLARS